MNRTTNGQSSQDQRSNRERVESTRQQARLALMRQAATNGREDRRPDERNALLRDLWRQ
ncbi:hypothetical protein [Limnoglobus roseus]|uniref:Uncharacterized protein n=1 Tax=Limnoglobus roseus TaxID=2598579 RepID=A0A5C1ATI5_9BACT|nr:hypothetical protein [Limnoglobus roseus]QEL20524.1 hypothetical protein PX52LOC_07629 [Limnoglobus roseus]